MLLEDFQCPICKYLVYQPRECIECGLICSTCFKRRVSSTFCPLATSHKEISKSIKFTPVKESLNRHLREPNQKILRKLDRVEFKCQCGLENLSYHELIHHLKQTPKCPKALIKCPKECLVIEGNVQMLTVISFEELENHLTFSCPSMGFQCKLCLFKGTISEKLIHSPHKCIKYLRQKVASLEQKLVQNNLTVLRNESSTNSSLQQSSEH